MDKRKLPKMSRALLDMKFMKKTKERVEKEEEEAEGQAMYANEITEEMKSTGNIVYMKTSIANCKDLIEGRLSFGGMNPEIENMMKSDYNKKIEDLEKHKEKDISDIEMAKGYSSLVGTMNKNFQNKKRNKKGGPTK